MSITTLAAVLFLLSPINGIDEQVKPYAQKFSYLTGKDVNLAIGFSEELFNSKFTAICVEISGVKRIYIEPSNWDRSTKEEQEALVMHELGHCVLGLEHNDTRLYDACPASIMSEKTPNQKCWEEHSERYLNEIRKR